MVDPEYLVLMQRSKNDGVEFACRVQAMAEWLLDHDAAPEPLLAVRALALVRELCLTELLDNRSEETISDREIEDDVAFRAPRLCGIVKSAANPIVQFGFGQVAADIDHLLRQPCPRRLVDVVDVKTGIGVANKALQRIVKAVPPAFRGPLRPGDADQRKVLWQHPGQREVVERRHDQALGQVAGRAKD